MMVVSSRSHLRCKLYIRLTQVALSPLPALVISGNPTRTRSVDTSLPLGLHTLPIRFCPIGCPTTLGTHVRRTPPTAHFSPPVSGGVPYRVILPARSVLATSPSFPILLLPTHSLLHIIYLCHLYSQIPRVFFVLCRVPAFTLSVTKFMRSTKICFKFLATAALSNFPLLNSK